MGGGDASLRGYICAKTRGGKDTSQNHLERGHSCPYGRGARRPVGWVRELLPQQEDPSGQTPGKMCPYVQVPIVQNKLNRQQESRRTFWNCSTRWRCTPGFTEVAHLAGEGWASSKVCFKALRALEAPRREKVHLRERE